MKTLIRKMINAMNTGFEEEAKFLASLNQEQHLALVRYKDQNNIW